MRGLLDSIAVYQRSDEEPDANTGTFDSDTLTYTPGEGWWMFLPSGNKTVWGQCIEFGVNCTPRVGAAGVVNVSQLVNDVNRIIRESQPGQLPFKGSENLDKSVDDLMVNIDDVLSDMDTANNSERNEDA